MTEKRNKEIIAYIQTLPSVKFIDDLEIMPEGHITVSFTEEFMELDSYSREYAIENIEDKLYKKYKDVLDSIAISEWYDGDNYVHLDIGYTDRAELAEYIRKHKNLFNKNDINKFMEMANDELSSGEFLSLVEMVKSAGIDIPY